MKDKRPQVAIIMGSDSDLPVMKDSASVLDDFGVGYEVKILSAHRTPEATQSYAKHAVSRGISVIIAGAGGAAHLAGVIASFFPLPVIGVPLGGLDALYSTVQMPPGVPVGAVGIDRAKNAALLAVEILATHEPLLLKKLLSYRQKLASSVIEKSNTLAKVGIEAYVKKISGKSS